ncbi:hypothetical protein FRB94_005525 [Tulasnella sp. JGI-2019a]|nr:hypothetical protein FRB93_006010 [Tulasnella sp. JGI-2019a]KAG9012590.1 hypothetical protein FRB94_005525 [Tulasnella sp. JGI-2019a]KAG9038281.1 hypothetical protein FRB95_002242 [Tulasnella sp. JGI-2019a]
MDLQYLAPKILAILTAPAVDLSTISAKRVRKQLIADGEPEDFLRQRKEDVDALIAQVYESVNNNNVAVVSTGGSHAHEGGNGYRGDQPPAPSSSPAHQKRKRSPSPYTFQSSQPQPLKSTNAKKPGVSNGSAVVGRSASLVKSDAELARQLSFELNGGRNTRGGGTSNSGSRNTTPKNGKAKASKKGSTKKSKATIDSDEDGGDDDDDRPKKKSKSGSGGGGGGFQKEYVLSDALAGIAGQTMLSRPQAVKKLWDHIKANNLQDPSDKREILCDDALKAVFRTDRLNMFKMNKLLGDHLMQPGERVE